MICARCQHFTTREHPEQAAIGWGHCVGFIAEAKDFVRGDREICRLYRKAEQMTPREAWIIKMEQSNSAVDAPET